MSQLHSQPSISKSIIKFIDIVLDLYSPVPYQIRNEMRILQNTILYNRNNELQEYIETLQQKLHIKQKYRQFHPTTNNNLPHMQNYSQYGQHNQQILFYNSCQDQQIKNNGNVQKSVMKLKNPVIQSQKQAKYYYSSLSTHNNTINNRRLNTSQNSKKQNDSISANTSINANINERNNIINSGQLIKNRKISAVQYLNKQQDINISTNTSLNKQNSSIGKNSSRTMLKIVKKNRLNKQPALSNRSISESSNVNLKIVQLMKNNVEEILGIMNKNQGQFSFMVI